MSSKYDTSLGSDLREAFQTFLHIHLMKTGPASSSHVFKKKIIILKILVDGHLNIITKYK